MSLVIVGGDLLSAVAGSEITLGTVVDSGGDVLAVLEAGASAIGPLFLTGMMLFVLGWLCMAMAFHRAPILPGSQNRWAIGALAAMAPASLVPQTTATYLYGVSLLVVSWLVGYRLFAEGRTQTKS